ncbi:GNAT family N-acetyltransferase [Halopseudomonas salegens]|uniref:Acetyltransferase (GNAT) domain-containing protein n=1 Tax=Halopseudomonas salegens TaxID=1434072 RepID=A0A1H2FPK2_9GAMM|nr:GNAT family N-acetyltransferase [Halopseudomonas salegens]SDU09291.1 Acetyltransferase (GNAT) domain-containing protein [Halopseudomonas salegens]
MRIEILPALQLPLVNRFYRAQGSRMRARGQHQVWVLRDPEICCALCLEPIAEGFWLTSLCTAVERRQQGLARQLLGASLSNCKGPVWLFCAPELGSFYQRHGFVPIRNLPHPLQQRLQRYQRHKRLLALQCTSL